MSSHYARLNVPLAVAHLVSQSTIYPMVEGSNPAVPVTGKYRRVCTKLGQSGQSGQSWQSWQLGQLGKSGKFSQLPK
jgi:hypothetical protein